MFVTFIALIATEFSGGTFRALLLRDPHRLRLIVGKLVGALVVAAGALALAEVLSFGLSLRRRPVEGHRHRRLVLARRPRPRASATTAPCWPASPAGPCSARRWP